MTDQQVLSQALPWTTADWVFISVTYFTAAVTGLVYWFWPRIKRFILDMAGHGGHDHGDHVPKRWAKTETYIAGTKWRKPKRRNK